MRLTARGPHTALRRWRAVLRAAARAAARRRACRAPVARAFLDQRHSADRGQRLRAGDRRRRSRCSRTSPAADEPGVDDEAGDDVRRPRAARPDYRWKTEAYAGRTRSSAACWTATWCSKATAIRRSRVEQFQEFIASAARSGLTIAIRGDLVLDRTCFAPARVRSRRFDAEPLRPYNVGPDALLGQLQERALRLRAQSPPAQRSTVRAEPPLDQCRDPRRAAPRSQAIAATGTAARAGRISTTAPMARTRPSAARYPLACGERDWYVALLDHPHYVLRHLFARTWADSGGSFAGTRARTAGARLGATRLADAASRRRSTTPCATSTSCRTTSWRGSFS